MKREVVLTTVGLVALSIAGHLFWNYVNYLDYLREIDHETGRWAVIEDENGHHIAVEPTSDEVWNQLVSLYQNGTKMWIGGIIEEYENKWGFRFKPESITIAEVTAEGLQATIQYISENLDYWINLGWAYVYAKVTEIND
jgi:hypothetical protein